MAKSRFRKIDTDYRPDASQEVLDIRVEELGLFPETMEKLKGEGLETVGDIARCEMRQLYKIDRMGKKDVFAVLRAIKHHGLDFKPVEKKAENEPIKKEEQQPQQKDKPKPREERNNNKKPFDKKKDKKPNNSGNNAKKAPQEKKNEPPFERKITAVPAGIEREKVNTRDLDFNGNKRERAEKPKQIKLPPLKSADGLYKFYKAGKWGYKDEGGKVVIEPQFDEAFNFSEGYAAVEVGERVGFINTKGEIVIPVIYDTVCSFSEGLASVTVDGKCAYIDKEGNEVFGFDYEAATSFKNDIALVKKDGKWGYMDRHTGEIRLR